MVAFSGRVLAERHLLSTDLLLQVFGSVDLFQCLQHGGAVLRTRLGVAEDLLQAGRQPPGLPEAGSAAPAADRRDVFLFFIIIVNTIAGLQTFDEAYTAFFGSGNTTYSNDAALFYVIYLFQQAFQFQID